MQSSQPTSPETAVAPQEVARPQAPASLVAASHPHCGSSWCQQVHQQLPCAACQVACPVEALLHTACSLWHNLCRGSHSGHGSRCHLQQCLRLPRQHQQLAHSQQQQSLRLRWPRKLRHRRQEAQAVPLCGRPGLAPLPAALLCGQQAPGAAEGGLAHWRWQRRLLDETGGRP